MLQQHELSELRFDPWAFFYNGRNPELASGEAIRMKNIDKLCEIWIAEEKQGSVKSCLLKS